VLLVPLGLVPVYGQEPRTGAHPGDAGADVESAVARFREVGGVAQWVQKGGPLMDRRSNSRHLFVWRYNGPEHRVSLAQLGVLREVTTLTLYGIDCSDDDLKQVAGWKHLEGLQLVYNRGVTDAGMKYVAGMPHLKRLVLWDTKVTSAGMKDIAALADLEYLEISNSPVGDAGLRGLEKNKRLATINLFGTDVTRKGLDALQRALPRCTIDDDCDEGSLKTGRETLRRPENGPRSSWNAAL
jgi:hypothetical protein